MSKGHLQRKGVVRQIRWERELLSMVDSHLAVLQFGIHPSALFGVLWDGTAMELVSPFESVLRNLLLTSATTVNTGAAGPPRQTALRIERQTAHASPRPRPKLSSSSAGPFVIRLHRTPPGGTKGIL